MECHAIIHPTVPTIVYMSEGALETKLSQRKDILHAMNRELIEFLPCFTLEILFYEFKYSF